MKRFILSLGLFCLLFIFGCSYDVFPPGTVTPSPSETPGDVTPSETPGDIDDGGIDFTLPDLSQEMVSFRSFRGTPALLLFFKTYCPHCQAEAQAVESIARKYSGLLVVLGIAVNESGTSGTPIVPFAQYVEMVRQRFVVPYGWTFPVLIDDLGRVQRALVGVGVPAIALVDAEGNIWEIIRGETSFSYLDARVGGLL
ncbi:MAG: TlpA family protein disulfide reductase [Candidatus Caldatribacteriaceae bacterium]